MAINGQFQFRRGTATEWSTANPVLLSGELGLETDTDQFKIGDGTSAWNSLPYGGIQGPAGQASQTIVGATTVINPNQNPSVTDADGGSNADLRFSLPRAREVVAQTTNTVAPGTAASVTQTVDAEGDVLLTFNVPRGANGWSPLLSVVTDGERRVLRLVDYVGGEGTKPSIPTDNYIGATGLTTLANAVDIRGAVGATGPAGQSVAVSDEGTQLTASATSLNFTGTGVTATNSGNAVTVNIAGNPNASGATPPAVAATGAVGTSADYARADHTHQGVTSVSFNGGTATSGAVSITESAAFANIAVSGQNTVVANDRNGTLTIAGAGSVTVTTDAANDTITINGNVSAPQNTFANVSVGTTPTPTVLQSDLAADTLTVNAGTGISLTADAATDTFTINNTGVTSVNGQSGAVTVPVMTVSTINAPSASFSTAVTTVISQAITGGSIAAGSMFEFRVRAQVINTTATSNLVATISIGATNVIVATQALGATARAAPGQPVIIEGTISFSSATAAEATVRAFTSSAVAFDAGFGTSAAVTVVTATNTTADIKLNTSAATSTVIVREASIVRIK